MGEVVRLWNLDRSVRQRPVVRQWAGFGDSIALGPDIVLRVFREVVDGDDCVTAVVSGRYGYRCEHYLLPGRVLNLTKVAGVVMRPRAIGRGSDGRPVKVLLEFQAMTDMAEKAFLAHKG